LGQSGRAVLHFEYPLLGNSTSFHIAILIVFETHAYEVGRILVPARWFEEPPMLAEIFLLRLEIQLRAAREQAETSRFVPLPKKS